MPLTRIVILSDGRPGHFNLAEGIAAAIERLGPADTVRIDVRRGRWSGAALAALTRSKLPARHMLKRVYGLDETTLPACDVVVSAGAETLAANIWLARLRAVPNVFYGSLRMFAAEDFALVLTSYVRNAGRARHALALKPSRFDPDLRPRASGIAGTVPTIGLLIGGDAGAIRYSEADWSELLASLSASGRQNEVRWRVANSRRTPASVSDALAEIAAASGSPVLEFLDVRASGSGTLAALMSGCDRMICTADSSSMVSECVWARLPTVAVRPRIFPLDRDERAYRDWLIQSGWCVELDIAELTDVSLTTAFAAIEPLQHNPLQALADMLSAKIPIKSLPA